MAFVTCLKAGLLTTVQDLGRQQYQYYGISVSGAMDRLSFRIANLLVGNPENFAAIEVAMMGPLLQFHQEGVIAITGADITPKINAINIPMWKAISIHDGDRLSFGRLENGCYAYIAFAGGVQVPEVMGSKSTFIRGHYGGQFGRALRKGDHIQIGDPLLHLNKVSGRSIPGKSIPSYQESKEIRFVWGPHDHYFTDEAKETFCSVSYKISNQSDRMGYRLSGKALSHKNNAQILSDYIAPGAIQVPGNGQPIVLMADCQMSGGYTKIGMVIGVDIPVFAQKKPGDRLRFIPVSIEAAQKEWISQEKWLSILAYNNHI
ncbi:biotin-dependent carboxyltransferase [Sporolactobacillus sp. THM7-4]|nr:biotin-dependent carboxyltransferase [Sporolactobacillus sp. THM7-4]